MIKPLIRRLPIFGGLADARLKDHKEAATEVGLNVVLSTIPIWLGAVIMLFDKSVNSSWFALLARNVSDGELFLYSTALLGPMYYFIFTEYPDTPNFPSSRMFNAFSTIILLVCVAAFSFQRAKELFIPQENIDNEFLFSLSWKVYVSAIVLVYLAHVYKNLRESAATRMGEDTRDFVEQWRSRGR